MPTFSKLILLACLVSALAGCDLLLTRPVQYGVVQTIVRQPDGTPIGGVHLTLFTGFRPMAYDYTASDGRFRFDNVPPGSYAVLALRPAAYRPCAVPVTDTLYVFSAAFSVAPNSHDTVTFTFPPC